MKHFYRQNSATVAVAQGGYSDFRLWPCFLAYTSTILFLAPFTGLLLAFMAVSTLAFLIAFKVANPTAQPYSLAVYQSALTEVVYRPAVTVQLAPVVAARIALPLPAQSPSLGEPAANTAWVLTAATI